MSSSVLLLPCSNKVAQAHFADTIGKPVPLRQVEKHAGAAVASQFRGAGSDAVPIWGISIGESKQKAKHVLQIGKGDVCVFTASGKVYATATVAAQCKSRDLAVDLWGSTSDGDAWENILFLRDVRYDVDLSYKQLNDLLGYNSNFSYQNFIRVNSDKAQALLHHLDIANPEAAKQGRDYLVLVHNELTAGGNFDDWKDVEGETYHFPNTYKNRVMEGRPFIYYRGTRRSTGRSDPEYFGYGRIGQVYRDEAVPESAPKKDWKWFCEIEDYEPFKAPVSWRRSNGVKFEDISQNLFQVGVRIISEIGFAEILSEANITVAIRHPLDVNPLVVNDLIVYAKKKKSSGGSTTKRGRRLSKRSKEIGDAGEKIVFEYLQNASKENGWTAVEWPANEGKTPGWDIEYVDSNGDLQAIEVKTTVGLKFSSVEITANEWAAAQDLRSRYWLYLVADVENAPQIQPIQNPCMAHENGDLDLVPVTYRIEWQNTED